MKILKKLENHFNYNFVGTTIKTATLARDVGKDIGGDLGGAAGAAGGLFVGSFVGGYKVWSPTAIAETLLQSDEKLEKREQEIKEIFDKELRDD